MANSNLSLARILMSAALAGSLLYSAPAHADAASAKRIVKAMSNYLANQKDLSGEFDADLDIITPTLEKIQFSASGSLLLQRPDKVRLVRKGGYAEVELLSDGNTMTIIDLADGSYAQAKSPGTVDGMINMLRAQYEIEMPGADLLLTNSYEELMEGVLEAKHMGVGVVDGKTCEHLAFRNVDTDWQLWVRTGDRPLPCKYVISSKTVASAPDYTVSFRNWVSGKQAGAAAFTFAPAPGARLVEFTDLSGIGDLPPPAPFKPGGQ